jgi:hypothetical protein
MHDSNGFFSKRQFPINRELPIMPDQETALIGRNYFAWDQSKRFE